MPPERQAVLLQLFRFLISGGLVTALGVGIYSFIALVLRWHPQLGNFLSYLMAMGVGYLLHSKWSFKGHGSERTGATQVRFVSVSLLSLVLNSLWVWLLTSHYHLPASWPILPMLFVTPLVTFTLNRTWVFA
ncbi:GtrA family protein [Sphingomonas ginkgonis]|uniref:GtrA family protein n=1 Tax=Sphingomonas ginkgonis TaxID=2315330 RepID=A0A429VDI4_9SPHN|nr:GtrA family protein [Sphingomonas ginkgonis]